MSPNRLLWHGPFPRSGWGRCRECGRASQSLFYWNERYPMNREAGRQALSLILCRRCIDKRTPAAASS